MYFFSLMKSYFLLAAAFLFHPTGALQNYLTRRKFALTTGAIISVIPESSASLTPPPITTVNQKMSSKLLAPRPAIVAVIGYTGGVGSCLLSAMDRINLKPFALVRSSTMKIGDGEDEPVDFEKLGTRLLEAASTAGGAPIIADVTASSIPQEHYKNWLGLGISVCTANKGIFAGPEKKYQEVLASVTPPALLLHGEKQIDEECNWYKTVINDLLAKSVCVIFKTLPTLSMHSHNHNVSIIHILHPSF